MTNQWEIDYADQTVLASIQVASAPVVHVVLHVANICSRSSERGEFAIQRLSADCWAVESGVFDAGLPPPHPMLPRMSLVLTHAPESVSAALERWTR